MPSEMETHFYDTITAYVSAQPSSRPQLMKALAAPITKTFDNHGVSSTENDLTTLWSTLISIVKSTPPTHTSAHTALVALVSDVKALGPLSPDPKAASTWAGTVFTDLPFLGPALRHAWNDHPPHTTAAEWASLNLFAAQLTATAVHPAAIFCIFTVRQTLEVRRPLAIRDSEDSEEPKSFDDVPLETLLPAVMSWLDAAGEQIARLSVAGKSFAPDADSAQGAGRPDPGRLGELAVEGEVGAEEEGLAVGGVGGEGKMVGKVTNGGFNAQRWRFWRARLEAVSEIKDAAGGREKVAKIAYQGLEAMKRWDGLVGAAD